VPPCEVYISQRNRDVSAVEPGEPMRVIVGVGLATQPAGARRFEIGRALGPVVGGSLLFSKVPRRELPALLSSIVGSVFRGYAKMGDPDEVAELTRRVSKVLSKKLRKQIEELARSAMSAPPPDLDAWVAAAQRSADRCGLLACADIASALAAVRARDEVRAPIKHEVAEHRLAALRGHAPAEDLARYWLSSRCEQALSVLGTPV
jgi:hypothetical protein